MIASQDHEVFLMSVIIRCIGLFAKAVKKIKGEPFLLKIFDLLTHICRKKVIRNLQVDQTEEKF